MAVAVAIASVVALSVWPSARPGGNEADRRSGQSDGAVRRQTRPAFEGRFLIEAVHQFTADQVRTVAEVAQQDVVAVSVGQVYLKRTGAPFATPVAAMAVDAAAYAAAYGDPKLAAYLRAGSVLSRSAASLLGLRAGDVTLPAEGSPLTIAAVVDDAALGGRQMAVARGASYAVGLALPTVGDYLVLSGATQQIPAILARLQRALPAKRLRAVPAVPGNYFSPAATVLTQSEIQRRFGTFGVRATDDGSLLLEPAWVDAYIIERHLPVLGAVTCNRAVLPDLTAAMTELDAAGLADLVDVTDFQRDGGCFAPRLVRLDSALSHHTWGIAIDINVARNPLGAASRQDLRLVAIMKAHNFTWGGGWVRRDAAHFEWYGRPVRESVVPAA